jgi:predicted  nucleic acid-binding Zn-ribbon protein
MSTILGQGDKGKEKQIQALTERVKDLERAFEDLEKATQASYNIDAINSGFDAMKSNLNEQIAATERMIQLEEDKKDTDHGKIADWKREIEDYHKQLQELEYERINQLGGIAGGDAIKSASENFVNAWVDAFKETGDGISGLEEQFNEVFMNLVKKQLLGRGVDKMLEGLYANLDAMLDDGAMSSEEYEDLNKQWNALSPQIDKYLTDMVNSLGIADDITKKTGELSGLQSGIQGITEDQADILAAYWSSVRFIVSNIEQKFTDYARQMLSSEPSTNPILGELKEHTKILNDIDDKLGSIIGHSGGTHVKTYLITQ